jgi:hypothetical protein
MKRYALVGWNPKAKRWDTEQIDARSKVTAKAKFVLMYPHLKKIKMYTLSTPPITPSAEAWAEHKAAEWDKVRELEEME